MSQTPYWGDAPLLWDAIKLGGITLYGVARPSGGISRRINTQPIAGEDSGGTTTDLGYDGAKVNVTVKMWRQEDLDAFQQFADQFRPRKDEAKPNPIDVIHPAINMLGIVSLTVEKIGIPEPSSEAGFYEVTIDFIEFIPETKKGKAVDGAKVMTEADTDPTQFGYAGSDRVNVTTTPPETPANNVAKTPPIGPALPPPVAPPIPQAPTLLNAVPLPVIGGQ